MNILYRVGLSLFCSAVITNTALAEDLQEREALGDYGMHFTKESISYKDSNVYLQIVPRAEGQLSNDLVEHGEYQSGPFVMYSQDPLFSEVGGLSFKDYILKSHDVVDTGPMYTLKSEMVLCWIGNEKMLVEVEQNKIRNYLKNEGRSYDNSCVSNALTEEYWQGRDHYFEVR